MITLILQERIIINGIDLCLKNICHFIQKLNPNISNYTNKTLLKFPVLSNFTVFFLLIYLYKHSPIIFYCLQVKYKILEEK